MVKNFSKKRKQNLIKARKTLSKKVKNKKKYPTLGGSFAPLKKKNKNKGLDGKKWVFDQRKKRKKFIFKKTSSKKEVIKKPKKPKPKTEKPIKTFFPLQEDSKILPKDRNYQNCGNILSNPDYIYNEAFPQRFKVTCLFCDRPIKYLGNSPHNGLQVQMKFTCGNSQCDNFYCNILSCKTLTCGPDMNYHIVAAELLSGCTTEQMEKILLTLGLPILSQHNHMVLMKIIGNFFKKFIF